MLEYYFVDSHPKSEFEKTAKKQGKKPYKLDNIFPPFSVFTSLFERLDISPKNPIKKYANIILLETNWHERYGSYGSGEFIQKSEVRRPPRMIVEILKQDLEEMEKKDKPCLIIAEKSLEMQVGTFLKDYSLTH
jgi:hypothetical protein